MQCFGYVSLHSLSAITLVSSAWLITCTAFEIWLFWPSIKWRHFLGSKFKLCAPKNIWWRGFYSLKLTYLEWESHKLSYLKEAFFMPFKVVCLFIYLFIICMYSTCIFLKFSNLIGWEQRTQLWFYTHSTASTYSVKEWWSEIHVQMYIKLLCQNNF